MRFIITFTSVSLMFAASASAAMPLSIPQVDRMETRKQSCYSPMPGTRAEPGASLQAHSTRHGCPGSTLSSLDSSSGVPPQSRTDGRPTRLGTLVLMSPNLQVLAAHSYTMIISRSP